MGTLQKKCACAKTKWGSCEHPWYDRVQINGQRRWICLKAAAKTAANRIQDKKRGERALKTAGIPIERETVRLLATLITEYLKHARVDHPATVESKDVPTLETFLDIVGNIDIRFVTPHLIGQWRLKRLKAPARAGRTLSRPTVNRELTIVRACFSWAEKQDWITHTPVRKVQPWKIPEVRRRILETPAEYQVVRDMPAPYNLINLLTLIYLPRLREVCALSRHDLSPLHVPDPYIKVRRKGGRIDKVTIDPELMTKLRAQLTTPEQEYLFPHESRTLVNPRKPGYQRKPSKWTELWICPAQVSVFNTRYFRSHGLHGISNHRLRHTGTTQHLTVLHTDAATLQVMGGWESRRMLDVYGQASGQSVQRAARAAKAHYDAMIVAAAVAPQTAQKKRSGPRNGPTQKTGTA